LDNYDNYCQQLVEASVPAREQEEAEASSERQVAAQVTKEEQQRKQERELNGEVRDVRVDVESTSLAWDRASALGITEQVRWLGEAVLQQQRAMVAQQVHITEVQRHMMQESERSASVQVMLQQLLVHSGLPLNTSLLSPIKQSVQEQVHMHTQAQVNTQPPPTLSYAMPPPSNPPQPARMSGEMQVVTTTTTPSPRSPASTVVRSPRQKVTSPSGVTVDTDDPRQRRYELKKAEIRQKILERKRNQIKNQHATQERKLKGKRLAPLQGR